MKPLRVLDVAKLTEAEKSRLACEDFDVGPMLSLEQQRRVDWFRSHAVAVPLSAAEMLPDPDYGL